MGHTKDFDWNRFLMVANARVEDQLKVLMLIVKSHRMGQ